MNFDLAKILQSKRDYRQRLASRPIEEKLAMLDALRERDLALRDSQPAVKGDALRDESPPYTTHQKGGRNSDRR